MRRRKNPINVRPLFILLLLTCGSVRAEEGPAKPVLLGIDVLEAQGFEPLKGKQVGLITNQSGVDSRGRSTVDVLAQAPGVRLIALFSPEHGIRGRLAAGLAVKDTFDSRTHLPIYSLYGENTRPTPEMLNSIDVLVFDMQDVGARFYTYLTTMGMAMEEASKRNIEFMVLDRPNPLGGTIIEGPPADADVREFTCYYRIPIRHGFTAGEVAQWYNETAKLHAQLKVVTLIGWKRPELWEDTELEFTPPSPNIRTPMEALLYAGLGLFEATNLSVGRGTSTPFQRMGAPWIKGRNFFERLKTMDIPGVRFRREVFIPNDDLYKGQSCDGVAIQVTDPDLFRPVDLFVRVACLLREIYPNDFKLRWDEIARVTGTRDFQTLYENGAPASVILDLFHKKADQFAADRDKYLLY